MKKLLMILTVTAFAVVAQAGDACCAAKKEVASADKAGCAAKAATCSAKAATCSAQAATCSAKSETTAACCKAGDQKTATKQLKSPRHASQS